MNVASTLPRDKAVPPFETHSPWLPMVTETSFLPASVNSDSSWMYRPEPCASVRLTRLVGLGFALMYSIEADATVRTRSALPFFPRPKKLTFTRPLTSQPGRAENVNVECPNHSLLALRPRGLSERDHHE